MTPRRKIMALAAQYAQQAQETQKFAELLLDVAETVGEEKLQEITDTLEREGVMDGNGVLRYRSSVPSSIAN